MTEKEFADGNKLIAEFMGGIYSPNAEAWGFGKAKNIGDRKFQGVLYHDVISAQRFEKELKYSLLWEWLIPAWGKFYAEIKKKLLVDIDPYKAVIELFNHYVNKNNVEEAFKEFVEILQYYQKNRK